MTGFTPSRVSGDAERTLATLIRPHLNPLPFASLIQRLQRMFTICKAGCPPPWAGCNLQITPEITYQSELWLPLDQLRPHYYALYRQALTYPPVLSITPFAQGTSWTAIVAGFPAFLQQCDNPAALLEQLVGDDELRMKFLFWSFMPERFYGGGSDRYPVQAAAIAEWIRKRRCQSTPLRCLDAASGDGANTYGVARLLAEQGWSPDRFQIEGWTLEPLEAWAAAQGRFPHDPARERGFREETRDCFEQGLDAAVRFFSVDILNAPEAAPFDLILCNGLLGGPIIHAREDMDAVVHTLAGLLVAGGILMVADHFHGGWKQKCPQQELRALCERYGLLIVEAEEGISALKPD
jgi:chemotaxis methyl-accepting protein methylase